VKGRGKNTTGRGRLATAPGDREGTSLVPGPSDPGGDRRGTGALVALATFVLVVGL
jgi:hypothetical protein